MLVKKVCVVVENIDCRPVTLLLMFRYSEDSYRVEVDQATYGYRFNDSAKARFKFYILASDKFSYIGNSHMLLNLENRLWAYLIFNDLLTWISNSDYYEPISNMSEKCQNSF